MIHSILPVQITCLAIFLHNLSPCPLWSTSWSAALHLIFQISSPNQCLLFATHAHTIATCFAVVSILYHLFLVFLNSFLGTLSVTLTLHIHLTILISARWSATSFSFLTGQVSLPCIILLRTQLLYSLPLLINYISLLVSNGTNLGMVRFRFFKFGLIQFGFQSSTRFSFFRFWFLHVIIQSLSASSSLLRMKFKNRAPKSCRLGPTLS